MFAFLQVLLAAFTMLALSSLSKSSRYVAILYAGAYWFSHAVFGVIYAITGSTKLSWLSLPGNLNQLGDVIFRLQPRYSTPAVASSALAMVAVIGGVALGPRTPRIRGVEVVS